MIDARGFLDLLHREDVRFFTGVPDSTLKGFVRVLETHVSPNRHVVAANEGNAVGLAAGYHLATGAVACVYMQNSGLGNAANPLISLSAPEVYGIPVVLVVGWRGEIRRGVQMPDEAQHALQGRITLAMLDCLEIDHVVLGPQETNPLNLVRDLLARSRSRSRPVALVVRRGVFDGEELTGKPADGAMTREAALMELLRGLPSQVPCVVTTGRIAREVYEYRLRSGADPRRDFLTVGSMGHALQIAAGVALALPSRRVACIDGDGAMIMHMGGLVTSAAVPNVLHLVLNNGAHESTGGTASRGFDIDMPGVARACGYAYACTVDRREDIAAAVAQALAAEGAAFVEVRTSAGSRPDLSRPKGDLVTAKRFFMSQLSAPAE